MEVYFVTSSNEKVREAEEILGIKLKQIKLNLKEIQSLDVKEVATDKARRAFSIIKKPVIVEDTGLYIESLNGFPGALIKWVLKTIGNKGLCKIVGRNRKAIAKTCVCFFDGRKCKVFSGNINGKIAKRPRGNEGFGWDSIFIPEGYTKTFAELGTKEKNKISMRRKAFLKLREFLLRDK